MSDNRNTPYGPFTVSQVPKRIAYDPGVFTVSRLPMRKGWYLCRVTGQRVKVMARFLSETEALEFLEASEVMAERDAS